MDEFKNLPKNKKILLHFAGFTVFIYRRVNYFLQRHNAK